MTTTTETAPAVRLGIFGACEHGEAIGWDLRMEAQGPAAVTTVIAAQTAAGRLRPHWGLHEDDDLTLDGIAAGGDLVKEWCMPRHHLAWWLDAFAATLRETDCKAGCAA